MSEQTHTKMCLHTFSLEKKLEYIIIICKFASPRLVNEYCAQTNGP